MVDFDRSVFIGKFQEEACDLLQRLNEGFISLETETANRELVDQVLRDAHTLKGSSRMVGLIEISDIAHWLENLMVRVRDDGVVYTSQMSDVVFEALDVVAFLAENARDDGFEHGIELVQLEGRLAALAEAEAQPATPVAAADPPAQAATPIEAAEKTPTVGVGCSESEAAASDAPDASQRTQRDEQLQVRGRQTIRVKAAQVDTLMNLVSEVVISEIKAEQRTVDLRRFASRLSDISSSWMRAKAAFHAAPEAGGVGLLPTEQAAALDSLLSELRRDLALFNKSYAEDVSRTSTLVHELQEQGMQLRMLPVNTVFQAFPRAVRDLARQFSKEIELTIEGGETELDKKVLEEINDPLVHLMRNAVDHGIEPPEVRVAAGKPACGTVKLSARPEGDHIIIEIIDDGAGIDPEAMRAVAVRKGFLAQSEAAAMSDREALFLIFEPGFSTSAIITEISGRGVGMDVVREFVVERLKGSLDVHSEPGNGTRFTLTIPLTLAVIRALLLNVSGQVFALPTIAVEETLRADPSQILKAEGREVIRRQRRNIPIVRLSDILGLPERHVSDGAKIPLVTVGYSGWRIGFVVDGFVGEQQIVIKPLGTHLRKVENIAGVTVLGAGELVPILNVPDLVNTARLEAGQRSSVQPADERGLDAPRRVLICEDSFTTRELERSIFESAGFAVETAPDGAAGLARLKEGLKVDAVVTDVQMPNMTGLELARAIKSDAVLRPIPVVIVTSLERDEEKAEGISAGADAYITKSVFNQDTLLDTVESLIR